MDRAGLRVFSSYGPTGGSARVRIFDWLTHLQLDAQAETYLGSARLGLRGILRNPIATMSAESRLHRRSGRRFDGVTLLSRRASPLSDGRLEARLLGRSLRGVYDFDDALVHDTRRPFGAAAVWKRAVKRADIVIAGNDLLAAQARELSQDVVVIPSCVEPSQYAVKHDYGIDGRPVAVWIGTPSTEKYLHTIEAALLEAHTRHGLRLRVISAGHAPLGALDAMVDRAAWTRDTFAADLADADFGIMPLTDDPWSRGKCAYKLLQYAASGLPMIGSPVGANRPVLSGASGWPAESSEEWSAALDSVITATHQERRDAGARGRALVASDYSFERWAAEWMSAVFGDSGAHDR